MKGKLFCEISPLTYKISVFKEILKRNIKNLLCLKKVAKTKLSYTLPIVVCEHKSLIRRKLGNVDLRLQDNKAVNLGIAAPKVSGVLIRPKETFSFWSLVGNLSKRKGYKEGLIVRGGNICSNTGGGMCQFTNLLHWLVLHSPLEITEHHHHNGFDLFPDFDRQVPFGVGTSILYNYKDYRFINNTDVAFQLIVYTTDKYLCGELRSESPIECKYHIYVEDESFSCENSNYYRNNRIIRKCVDKRTGNVIENRTLMKNHAKVMYDSAFINKDMIRA